MRVTRDERRVTVRGWPGAVLSVVPAVEYDNRDSAQMLGYLQDRVAALKKRNDELAEANARLKAERVVIGRTLRDSIIYVGGNPDNPLSEAERERNKESIAAAVRQLLEGESNGR